MKEVSKAIEEQDSGDDNSGLSQVTIESVKRAEEEYRNHKVWMMMMMMMKKNIKPPLTVGEKIDEPFDFSSRNFTR